MLLEGQLDVDADGTAAGFVRAAVAGFHDPRAAAGHDGEADLGDGGTHLAGHLVVGGAGLGAGGAEDRHGRADEVEGAEGADEIQADPGDGREVVEAGARAGQETAVGVFQLEAFFLPDGLLADGVLGSGSGAIGAIRWSHGS